MDQLNMYLFTEYEGTKAVIVERNIEAAISKLQIWLDEKNEAEEFTQTLRIADSRGGVSDWDVVLYESYKPTESEIQVMAEIVSTTYEVFELPFSIGKVYGAIGNF